MDSTTFNSLVELVQRDARTKQPPSWAAAAAHVANTLASYPDGVTEAMLLTSLPARPEPTSSLVAGIKASRRVDPHAVLDLQIAKWSDDGGRNVELADVGSSDGPSLILAADGALVARRGTLLFPSRRLRLTRCATAECAASGGGPLLLLPTAAAAPILDGTNHGADRGLLDADRQHSRLRGRPEPAPGEELRLVLRVADVAPPETHGGRPLRRLLLELDDGNAAVALPEASAAAAAAAGEPRENEAELLLWDESIALLELIPPRALLYLVGPSLLSSGSATPRTRTRAAANTHARLPT